MASSGKMQMFVNERFVLDNYTVKLLHDMEPNFGYNGFGEFIFYRTYSRMINGKQEDWADVCCRVISGMMSIRKDWYIKNHISWNEKWWQAYSRKMAISLFKMEWMPGGRGLWAMGTDFVYERGGMALNNCGYSEIHDDLADDIGWTMDGMMLGLGVGFTPIRNDKLEFRKYKGTNELIIADSREGWVESEQKLIRAIQYGKSKPRMIYDEIRPEGEPIRGFGGVASGPEPLKELHERTEQLMDWYMTDPYYDSVMLKTDLQNLVGVTVVSGNVRRSAELACLSIKDPTFKNLKNYEDDKYAYRKTWGWMSNNSVDLEDDEDFDYLSEIAQRVISRGEPGYKNLQNFKYGRIGKKDKVRIDRGRGNNACEPFSAPVIINRNGQSFLTNFGELKEGDRIWSKNDWTTVIKKWSTGINKVYKYRTTAGYFLGTADHQIVYQGFKIPVKDSFGIDIIPGPYKPIKEHNPQFVLDGLMLGDGTKHSGRLCLIIGEDDQDYYNSEINYLIREEIYSSDKSYKIHLVNTTLGEDEVCRTFNRRIPNYYMTLNRVGICSFLRGIFSANGGICGDRVALKQSSFELIEQVQLMLNSVGIRSYYTTNKSKLVTFKNGEYQCKESYDINITADRDKFAESIGFLQEYKNIELQSINNRIGRSKYSQKLSKDTYDIINIEYIGEEETFDITVDNYSHTYWTGGCHVSNCGEVILEGGFDINGKDRVRELCNQAETLPTVCNNPEKWIKAVEYATVYASTVSLIMTHQPSTNRVIARNRRISVGIIDQSGWKLDIGVNQLTKWLRLGYDKCREINKRVNAEAGVPEAIRVTTIKPGGTTPKLPGKTPGIGHPTFDFTLRRVNVAKNSPIVGLLIDAGVPYEDSVTDKYSYLFEWPIFQGPAAPAEKISLWEQAMNLVLMQREWADNAVSNTLYFKPKWSLIHEYTSLEDVKKFLADNTSIHDEYINVLAKLDSDDEELFIENYKITCDYSEDIFKIYQYNASHEEDAIEPVLSAIAPLTKTVSLLPHSAKGVYKQMPEEQLTKYEYEKRLAAIKKIDWSKLKGSDGQDERYCSGPQCDLPVREIKNDIS